MKVATILTSLVLALAVAGFVGCKKDEGASGGGGGGAAASEEKIPAKADIDKIDCDKACGTQVECYKKGGMANVNPEEMKKNCKMGCDALKAAYDPKMHGKTAAVFLKFADGKCE